MNLDNQHEKITGYRDLTQAEIDLMNDIKAHGKALEALTARVQAHVIASPKLPHEMGQAYAPARFAAMAVTEFQTGLMYLTRAVARPTSF